MRGRWEPRQLNAIFCDGSGSRHVEEENRIASNRRLYKDL